MRDKQIVVTELQDQSVAPPVEPPASGALVGIEKPVPVVELATSA